MVAGQTKGLQEVRITEIHLQSCSIRKVYTESIIPQSESVSGENVVGVIHHGVQPDLCVGGSKVMKVE